ncbi:unnamed protein product [Bursaphelenchus okinawaensis]|uniref:Potassium channel domain-containing protein n=1 Tax=Bursaphelenchus okinawaensis TaxID=465554 RepID=A0A811L9L3_9BILA|nr:unnamed protein product [Bursaphelenchus okinawaensis]CAG9119844.1 unnamed protein product [Bursaphelenchus okinawaensis]
MRVGEDNVAIQIDQDDDTAYHDVYNDTVENDPFKSSKTSLQQLLPSPDDVKSMKSSVHESLKSVKFIGTKFLEKIKNIVMVTKLWWLTVAFTLLGGYIFMWLETPADLEQKRQQLDEHLMSRDVFLFNIEMIHNSSSLQKRNEWKNAIMEFERRIGYTLPEVETSWTFWMSVLYAGTISTTIGYGNIGCITTSGRIMTIFYAILGIPLFVVILDKIGAAQLSLLKAINYAVEDFLFFIYIRMRFPQQLEPEKRRRYKKLSVKYANYGLFNYKVPLKLITQQESVEAVEERRIGPKDVGSMYVKSAVRPLDDITEIDEEFVEVDNHEFKHVTIQDTQNVSTPERPRPLPRQVSIETGPSRRSSELSQGLSIMSDQSGTIESQVQQEEHICEEIVETEETVEKTEEEEEEDRDPPVAAALVLTVGHITAFAAIFCLWEEWDYFTSFYFLFISLSTIGFGDVTPAYPEYMVGTFFVVLIGLALVTVCINVVQEKITIMYMRVLTRMLDQYIKAQESGDPEALKGFVEGFNSNAKFLMPLLSKNESAKVMKKFRQTAKDKGVSLPSALTEIDPQTGQFSFCNQKSDDIDGFIEKKRQEAQNVINTSVYKRNTCGTQTNFHNKAKKVQTTVPEWLLVSYSYGAQFSAELSDSGNQTDTDSVDSGCQCEVDVESTSAQFDADLLGIVDCATTMGVEYADSSIQPEVSFIRQLLEQDSDGSWEMSETDSDDNTTGHNELPERRRRVREGFQKKLSRDDGLKRRESRDKLRFMKSRNVQTEFEQTSTECQAGPSTFTGYTSSETMDLIIKKDAETQPDLTRTKNNYTQVKYKVKHAEIQNYVMDEFLFDTDTQTDTVMMDSDTQVELQSADQVIQTDVEVKAEEVQTEIVEFANIKAIRDGLTQTDTVFVNKKAQTALTYTLKNIDEFEKQKKKEYENAKSKFERLKQRRGEFGGKQLNTVRLDASELEVLKSKLFKIRLEHAKKQKMENEPIEFDVNGEVQKLLDLLQNLRVADGELDKDEIRKILEESHFPLELIEKDFDFDRLVKLLEEESQQGDDSDAELLDDDVLVFMKSTECQTNTLGLQMVDVELMAKDMVKDSEGQTVISMAEMQEKGTQPDNNTSEVGVQHQPDTKDAFVIAKPSTALMHSQTVMSMATQKEKEVQSQVAVNESVSQTELQYSNIALDPILEVIKRNKPVVSAQDTQTAIEIGDSMVQTERNGIEKDAQVSVETATVSIDAVQEYKTASTSVDVAYRDSECQWAQNTTENEVQTSVVLQDWAVQATVTTSEKSEQNLIEFAESATQSMVSSMKKMNKENDKDKEEAKDEQQNVQEDVYYPVDQEVQYEEPRRFVDTGSNALVSMFKRPDDQQQAKEGIEGSSYKVEADDVYLSLVASEDEEYYLMDSYTQHDTELADTATMPIVSMFKMKERQGEEENGADGDQEDVLHPKDTGVQHDREMEDYMIDKAIQPNVSMFKAVQKKVSVGDVEEDELEFMTDDFTQVEVKWSTVAVGSEVEYLNKEVAAIAETTAAGCQSDIDVEDVQTQFNPTTSDAFTFPNVSMFKISEEMSDSYMQQLNVTDTQFLQDCGCQYDAQYDGKVDKESQHTVEFVDERVGDHYDVKDNGVQSLLSMFKINMNEYVKRRESAEKEDGQGGQDKEVEEVNFLIDASTEHDYTVLSSEAGTQLSYTMTATEQQTVYSGTIVDAETTHDTHFVNLSDQTSFCSCTLPRHVHEESNLKVVEVARKQLPEKVAKTFSKKVQATTHIDDKCVGEVVERAPFGCQMSAKLHEWGVQYEYLNTHAQYVQTEHYTRTIESQMTVEQSNSSVQTVQRKPPLKNSKNIQTDVVQSEVNADVYVTLHGKPATGYAATTRLNKHIQKVKKVIRSRRSEEIQTDSVAEVVVMEHEVKATSDAEVQVSISKDLVEYCVSQTFRKPIKIMRVSKVLKDTVTTRVEKNLSIVKKGDIKRMKIESKTERVSTVTASTETTDLLSEPVKKSRLIKRRPLGLRKEIGTQTHQKPYVSLTMNAELRCLDDALDVTVTVPGKAAEFAQKTIRLHSKRQNIKATTILASKECQTTFEEVKVKKRSEGCQTEIQETVKLRKMAMYQSYNADNTAEVSTQTGVLARLATQYREGTQVKPESPKSKKR